MEAAIRRLRIQAYKGQVAACSLECVALKMELERADLTKDQRLFIGHRLDEASKERISLLYVLARFEQGGSADKTVR